MFERCPIIINTIKKHKEFWKYVFYFGIPLDITQKWYCPSYIYNIIRIPEIKCCQVIFKLNLFNHITQIRDLITCIIRIALSFCKLISYHQLQKYGLTHVINNFMLMSEHPCRFTWSYLRRMSTGMLLISVSWLRYLIKIAHNTVIENIVAVHKPLRIEIGI